MAIGDWAISAVKNRPPKTAAILHSVRSSRVFVHLARIINPPPAFIPPYTQSQFTFFHPGVDPVYEIKLRPGLHSYEIAEIERSVDRAMGIGSYFPEIIPTHIIAVSGDHRSLWVSIRSHVRDSAIRAIWKENEDVVSIVESNFWEGRDISVLHRRFKQQTHELWACSPKI